MYAFKKQKKVTYNQNSHMHFNTSALKVGLTTLGILNVEAHARTFFEQRGIFFACGLVKDSSGYCLHYSNCEGKIRTCTDPTQAWEQ